MAQLLSRKGTGTWDHYHCHRAEQTEKRHKGQEPFWAGAQRSTRDTYILVTVGEGQCGTKERDSVGLETDCMPRKVLWIALTVIHWGYIHVNPLHLGAGPLHSKERTYRGWGARDSQKRDL